MAGYLGQKPTPSPLTTSDLGDGIVTAAKLAPGAVVDEITKQSSDPTVSSPATPTLGDVIVNTTSGEMFTCTTVSSGANVWTNTGDGTGSIASFTGMVGTGGTITTDGDYKVHAFNSSGTFEITTVGTTTTLTALVVAGAGGGGGDIGGGGGAGGVLYDTALSVSQTSYSITVGGGGTAQTSTRGNTSGSNGANSVFHTMTAVGGGLGGGYATGDLAFSKGKDGGSGGGAGTHDTIGDGSNTAGTATSGQGNDGGTTPAGATEGNAAGGGGKGAVGGNGSTSGTATGTGGVGYAYSITGSSIYYAGGGGGMRRYGASGTGAAGGNGGGGRGGSNSTSGSTAEKTGSAGTVNLGGGGGGGTYGGAGGAGGSGVVIIRYKFQ
jgi:hypothetical protein